MLNKIKCFFGFHEWTEIWLDRKGKKTISKCIHCLKEKPKANGQSLFSIFNSGTIIQTSKDENANR